MILRGAKFGDHRNCNLYCTLEYNSNRFLFVFDIFDNLFKIFDCRNNNLMIDIIKHGAKNYTVHSNTCELVVVVDGVRVLN